MDKQVLGADTSMKNAMILLVASLILVIIGLCLAGVLIVWYNWMDKLVPHYQRPVINFGLSMIPIVFLVWGLLLLEMKFG